MTPALRSSLLAMALASVAAASVRLDAQETDKVLAILNRRCVECHGTSKQSGKLRLDSIDAVFKGGRSGPPVIAGKSGESFLYERITAEDSKKRMPQKGDALDAGEIETIRRWIDSGAKAAASTPGAEGASGAKETVTPHAERLPADFAPVFSLAGDPVAPRLAVGRGTAVDVYEIVVEADGGDGKKDEKEGKTKKAGTEARLLTTLRGHSDVVQCVAFSSDGKRLASGELGVVRVWSAEKWELLRELKPHADRVLAIAFSPDGKKIASGGGVPAESGELKVWDIESGKEIWSVTPHSDTVLGLAWSADGKVILTGAADRVTYLLDAENGKQLRRLEAHTHHVLAVALSPDGKRAATAGADRVVKLWDLEKGELVKNARGSEKPITSVVFHDGGKRFVSTSGDGQVRFWEWENAKERFNFGEAKGYLQAGSFLAGEKLYAAAEEDGPVRVYDVEKRKLLVTIAR